MKTILLTLSASSLLLLGPSCRTFVPIDPNTGVPSCTMMPSKGKCCDTKDCTPCCHKVEVKPSK